MSQPATQTIPIIDTADIVIAGGTTAAVAAAVAAAQDGSSVFLGTAFSYLGDDLCSSGRWWQQPTDEATSPLAESLYTDTDGNTLNPTTPMTIKCALDQALIAGGVSFLFNLWPVALLQTPDGAAAGVVFATREGLVGVQGKVVIDATWQGTIARATQETSPTAGTRQAVRYVVGAPAADLSGEFLSPPVTFTTWDNNNRSKDHQYQAYRYTLPVDLQDESTASIAAAEHHARTITFAPEQSAGSENIFIIPSPAIKGQPGDLGAYTAATPRLLVAGPAAALTPEAQQTLSHPNAMINLGTRLGDAANDLAAATPTIDHDTTVQLTGSFDPTGLQVHLASPGLRPYLAPNDYATIDLSQLPILDEVDVLVAGGGTGGAPAGISAARAGGNVVIIEALHGLGGVGTLGLIASYYYGYREGFTKEVNEGVAAYLDTDPLKPRWNPAHKAEWLRQEAIDAGAKVWFNAIACGVILDGRKVQGAIVATPHGFGIVRAKVIIDSTGNADIPGLAGIECQTLKGDHLAVQGTGLPPIFPGVGYYNTDYTFIHDCDLIDAWRAFIAGRQKYRRHFDMAQLLDTRERRQIIGDVQLDPADVYQNRTWPDTVAIHRSNFDTHGFTIHPIYLVEPPDKESWDANVPIRALMPKDLDGVLSTGLGVSAHRDVMPIIRMQACVQNQGYAVGKAAVMALDFDGDIRQIDIKELQHHLVATNCLPQTTLAEVDSFPIDTKIVTAAIDEGLTTHTALAAIYTEPKIALPHLRQAHDAATDPQLKQRYARALAILGDSTGAKTLTQALADSPWDDGWHYTGMGQFGRSLSPVDDILVCLAMIGEQAALPAILEKATQLTEEHAFSHHRAIAYACERIANRDAAPVLSAILATPGIGGHAINDIHEEIAHTPESGVDTTTRNVTLRELVLAAALYRVGDYEGHGQRTLEAYAKDFRGHYTRYATAVLNGK